MPVRRGSAESVFVVEPCGNLPIFQQIYRSARSAIAGNRLRPGDRLPSARSLAAQLGVARGTVDAAYAILAGEGWILSHGAAGTIVAPRPDQNAVSTDIQTGVHAIDAAAPAPLEEALRPFRMGLPALDKFPRKLWARLASSEARTLSEAAMAYPDPCGLGALREAIAGYLAVSRGIACHPRQIFVTAGYQGALGLITRALIKAGDKVWFEDPGYPLARQALIEAGARLVPIAVDADGMRVGDALARAPHARFAIVTPAHQCPLGVTLSLARKRDLLVWAASAEGWVIEDDYDAEFHYCGVRPPPLKSLDDSARVLYAGTFSKVLFPALGLGYLVVPEELIETFAHACRCFRRGFSGLEQAVIARFIQEGHFARHLKRMRSLYAARRKSLAAALNAAFGERLQIELSSGGMHIIARMPSDASDVELVLLAREHGLMPDALSRHAIERDCGHGLLLAFTNVSETQAPAMAQMLFAAVGSRLRRNHLIGRPSSPSSQAAPANLY